MFTVGVLWLAVQGIPAVEFRARCDLIFEKYDKACLGFWVGFRV